jgi:hypothetical protein
VSTPRHQATYLDQLLTYDDGRIDPDFAKEFDFARRAWRDSRLDAWQASWFKALVLDLLPPVLLGLVSRTGVSPF